MSGVFSISPTQAVTDFLDEIMALNGVYMLSQRQMLEWMKVCFVSHTTA